MFAGGDETAEDDDHDGQWFAEVTFPVRCMQLPGQQYLAIGIFTPTGPPFTGAIHMTER